MDGGVTIREIYISLLVVDDIRSIGAWRYLGGLKLINFRLHKEVCIGGGAVTPNWESLLRNRK